jgi:DNA-binding transcriptional LysR family regulator
MELRHLRYFVAVAEELHFTAQRNGSASNNLPQLAVRHLEQEIGTSLFRRLKRGVELTETGILLLDEARGLLAQVEQAKTAVQSHARGAAGRIHLGFAARPIYTNRSSALFAPIACVILTLSFHRNRVTPRD